jgi:DNA-binding response OmpR family regulator
LLIVDDEADVGRFIADVVEPAGWRCTVLTDTSSFEAALAGDVAVVMPELIDAGRRRRRAAARDEPDGLPGPEFLAWAGRRAAA